MNKYSGIKFSYMTPFTSEDISSDLDISPMKEAPPSPPPAPPLPHRTGILAEKQDSDSKNKPSIFLQKLMAYSADHPHGSFLTESYETIQPKVYQKSWYFFYGTLKDPKILAHVLDDSSITSSSLRPAYIVGYARTMWGQYQALVDGHTGTVVDGMAFEVESEEDERKLASYETNAYRVTPCIIRFISESQEIEPEEVHGKTFKYAGDARALKEGRWDRKLWVRNMAADLKFGDGGT